MNAQSITRPTIVCLCGSTRFYETFQLVNYEETMKGKIVLSICYYPGSPGCTPEQKIMLDAVYRDKIDLADEVLFLNVNGYMGESTLQELVYAIRKNKKIRFLEPNNLEVPIVDTLQPVRQALSFYADKNNWIDPPYLGEPSSNLRSEAVADGGKKAREVLSLIGS